MSEQEMLVLSTRDRDRLKVLHEVKQGHLTQREAAEQLKVTDRWVRQLLGRVGREGDRGVVHRQRGRASPRRLGEGRRKQILKLVKRQYHDFGPTLAAEYLQEKDGIAISKEALRQLLIEAGWWRCKRRRAEEVHVNKTCRAIPGNRGSQQDLLIAFLEDEPDAPDPYVDLFGNQAPTFDAPDFA